MKKTFSHALVLSGLLLFGASGAIYAQDSAADPVVAIVNGEDIHESELMEAAAALPAEYQTDIESILPVLLDRLVDLKLVVDAGKADGLDQDEEVGKRVEQAETQIISQVYIERALADRMTDEALQARYDEMVAAMPSEQEVHARHILLESEEDAKAVIAELDNGADFVELAKERSTGPSAPQGGDLGYFSKGQMVAPFAEVAFVLEPGTYSEQPVETQFGWHVILVEDKRDQQPPSFEDLEPQIRNQVNAEGLEEVLGGLRDNAEIEILIADDAEAMESEEMESEEMEAEEMEKGDESSNESSD